MSDDKKVKFIRKNGRVIPIRGEGSAPAKSGVSKRYGAKRETPKTHGLSGAQKGATVAAGAAAGALLFRGGGIGHLLSGIALGAAVGRAVSKVTVTKRGRGESQKQLAQRAGKKSSV